MRTNLRLSAKANMFMAAMLVVLLGVTGNALLIQQEFKPEIASTQETVRMMSDDYLRLNNDIHDIRLHVVQVQQFLTDISATRGQNGLDDGAGEAAEHAKAFYEKARDAKRIAMRIAASPASDIKDRLYMKRMAEAVSAAEAAFPAYYRNGIVMSRRYVAEGPEGGNTLMPVFDRSSLVIQDKMAMLDKVMAAALADKVRNQRVAFHRLNTSLDNGRLTLLILGAAAVALLAGAGLYVRRSLVRPLIRATGALRGLADQDLTVEAPVVASRDEVADIVGAIAILRDRLREAERLRLEQEAMRAQAEAAQLRAIQLERDAEAQRAAEQAAAARAQQEAVSQALHAMAEAIEQELARSVAMISTEATNLKAAAGNLTDASAGVIASSDIATANSQGALQAAQTVAAAAEEMSAAIGEISRQVFRSADLSRDAVSAANQTRDIISGMVTATDEISSVVDMINQIAEQTNLLALNATIESARAGEAGRGFAVVASEVKSLAGQTTKLTENIRNQVASMQSVVSSAVKAIDHINAHITAVDESSGMIAASIEQQSNATQEIASSIQSAASAVDHVVGSIDTVRGSAGDSAGQAQAVNESAEHLNKKTLILREQLIHIVRTAVPQVDRRSARRANVRVRGSVLLPGSALPFAITTANLSTSGAFVAGIDPAIGLPDIFELSLEGLGSAFKAYVVERRDEGVRVRFDANEAQRAAIERLIGDVSESLARAA